MSYDERLEDAEHLHRESLLSILFDLRIWMDSTAGHFRTEAERKRRSGRPADSRSLCEQADGIKLCLNKLQELRKQHMENSNAKRVQMLKVYSENSGNYYEPSEEEIKRKCEEIREGWTPNEMASRHWQKVKRVDSDPTAFTF